MGCLGPRFLVDMSRIVLACLLAITIHAMGWRLASFETQVACSMIQRCPTSHIMIARMHIHASMDTIIPGWKEYWDWLVF